MQLLRSIEVLHFDERQACVKCKDDASIYVLQREASLGSRPPGTSLGVT
jgi:hypothetical protein